MLFCYLGMDDGKKKKKKVSWATEDNLTRVHYFQLDESERGRGRGERRKRWEVEGEVGGRWREK